MPFWLENSDYVARFRFLEEYNIVSDASITSNPPDNVINRLNSWSLLWSDLTILAKQAILWDMGLIRIGADPDPLTQTFTVCTNSTKGVSMATIAIPEHIFSASQDNATLEHCNGPDGAYVRQRNSDGRYLGKYVRCAVQYLDQEITVNSHASMWAQDGLGTKYVPDARFWRHEYISQDFFSFLMFGIHTVPTTFSETVWGSCPEYDKPGSLIIPCTVLNPPVNLTKEVTGPDNVTWCVPEYSATMNKWLSDIKETKTPKSKLSMTAIIVIAVGGAILIFAFIFFCLCLRKKRKVKKNDAYRRMSSRGNTETRQTIKTLSESLNAFQEDPKLCLKRIPNSSIKCESIISQGAFGEVWIGTLEEYSELENTQSNKRIVAIKRILPSRRSNAHELACFADEIRLMALFSHPNIVTFIGFGWDILQNLSCVTEYLSNGDLSTYLANHKHLEWKVKIRIGHGILSAIMYLQQLSPPVIHRDLKGKNVLVADDISAKLSDFGMSRQRQAEETMTMGVGTTFWTAPEVLLDKKYDASVDIYSFGCIMSELDTHTKPYSDMKDIASLNLIQKITGQSGSSEPLRPKFTKASPDWFREVASACLAHNPSLRPAIADLVSQFAQELGRLESINNWQEYSF
ncbi:kinase [Thraustotheca clavata]|uniref:Kinase n=1 Tax=Thraustotheca clavata TaxID=74557 RepID=A0A1V9ZW77_9STRA|nr:kinase [Thraustotheca clavata]